MDALRSVARAIARTCGVPDTAEYSAVNGVQLFDYSSRSRCLSSCKILSSAGHTPIVLPATQESARVAAGKTALVLPVGDALIEPFWPQGLGINRGFHTAIDAAWVADVARRKGLGEAVRESRFAYECLNYGQWSHISKYVADEWVTDPLRRYTPTVVKGVASMVQAGKKGDPEEDLPLRVRGDAGAE
mmetsp:Transcript_3989/g.9088  ORF Transcript_3989/g.9088 Transcript_3989/m.9088 type:complete len:188 (+) Transcript_3989:1399-1962(+)